MCIFDHFGSIYENIKDAFLSNGQICVCEVLSSRPVHRGALCQFLFRWIYYCHSSKSTGKKTDKMHLCAVYYSILNSFGQRSQYISIKFPLH